MFTGLSSAKGNASGLYPSSKSRITSASGFIAGDEKVKEDINIIPNVFRHCVHGCCHIFKSNLSIISSLTLSDIFIFSPSFCEFKFKQCQWSFMLTLLTNYWVPSLWLFHLTNYNTTECYLCHTENVDGRHLFSLPLCSTMVAANMSALDWWSVLYTRCPLKASFIFIDCDPLTIIYLSIWCISSILSHDLGINQNSYGWHFCQS